MLGQLHEFFSSTQIPNCNKEKKKGQIICFSHEQSKDGKHGLVLYILVVWNEIVCGKLD